MSMASSITKVSQNAISKDVLDFIQFLNASPSPFHAVHEAVSRLSAAGFQRLSERSDWSVNPNGKYYFTRNGSSLVAFVVGGLYQPGNGFSIVGAHTDSPCLKIKPISKLQRAGYLEVGVHSYGGGIWHTWFDRDLSVAGRVMVEHDDGTFKHTLVNVKKPILRVPTLAIHLDRAANDTFKFNQETEMVPILATAARSTLNNNQSTKDNDDSKHHTALINALADELKVEAGRIHDFELCLYDTQPATVGGVYDEFIYSARLDNLGMSYCALSALVQTCDKADNDPNIRMIVLFDNEEVGSTTAQGANSSLLPSTLERLMVSNVTQSTKSKKLFKMPSNHRNDASAASLDDTPSSCLPNWSLHRSTSSPFRHPLNNYEQAIQKSMLVSADMAHAVHPNYVNKYEENHRPAIHKGTVIKINANQKYATTAPTSLIMREIAKRRAIPVQEFVVRNDSPCGSTIGPMLSAKLGIRTIDIGNPQLSMHSIREVAGVEDVSNGIQLLEAFFELFPTLDQQVMVDDM